MRRRITGALAVLLLGLPVAVAEPAAADISLPTVVSDNPVDWTPHVLDGNVWAIAVVGPTVIVAGDFTTVRDAVRGKKYTRNNIFAYTLTTGAVLPWAPSVDGPVLTVAAGPANTVYIGGSFETVNKVAQRGLARLSLNNGKRVAGYKASINWGDVRSLIYRDSRLYAGGAFSAINGVVRAGLARLDPTTGAVDAGFDAKLTAPGLARVRVEDIALDPDGQRLVILGALKLVDGVPRDQIAMLDVAGPHAVLTDWLTTAYSTPCLSGFDTYLRAVDFAPTGDYFVVVSTGRQAGPTMMCDAATRFDTAGSGEHAPVWVNRTGGDSLYAVSVTGSAVYVSGHQRWMNNPLGKEAAGPGAVARQGIAALDPSSGLVLPWNPSKDRGVGTRALVATSAGLLVGSDTTRLGGEFHARLGMFPLI